MTMRGSRALNVVAAFLLTLAPVTQTLAQPASGEPAATPTPAASPATDDSGDDVAVATTSAEDRPMDAGAYAVRLRDLEQRINELKEQIFRSKTRLSLLAETVLGVVVAGSQVVITHENQMSSS